MSDAHSLIGGSLSDAASLLSNLLASSPGYVVDATLITMISAEFTERARRLRQVLGRSDLHLVNEYGHMVTYADPGSIAQAVDRLNLSVQEPVRIISSREVPYQPRKPPGWRPSSLRLAVRPEERGNGMGWRRDETADIW